MTTDRPAANRLMPDALRALLIEALIASNTSPTNAGEVADALLAAELDGLSGHGAARLPAYAAQAKSGKVNGHAVPVVAEISEAGFRIDAGTGFAYPAISAAIAALAAKTKTHAIAAAAIANSHHFGAAGYHVERLAGYGLIGLCFGNSPHAIAPWGGNRGLFGTNPIAFAAPRRDANPLVIDLSLSKVARGRVMVAARKGEAIPEDWAFDAEGKPTTDAEVALAGTMAPMGDAKGAALVMMVEILAVALTSSNFGYEATSFFDAEGEPPRTGQFLVAIAPGGFSDGAFQDRLETLIEAVLTQPGARLPGARRLETRQHLAQEGILLPEDLRREIEALRG